MSSANAAMADPHCVDRSMASECGFDIGLGHVETVFKH